MDDVEDSFMGRQKYLNTEYKIDSVKGEFSPFRNNILNINSK